MSISDELKRTRASQGMTQEAVAAGAGMHVTQYNGYERGRSRPSMPVLARIAEALNVSVDELLPAEPASTSDALSETASFEEIRDEFRDLVAARLGLTAEDVIIRIELR